MAQIIALAKLMVRASGTERVPHIVLMRQGVNSAKSGERPTVSREQPAIEICLSRAPFMQEPSMLTVSQKPEIELE